MRRVWVVACVFSDVTRIVVAPKRKLKSAQKIQASHFFVHSCAFHAFRFRSKAMASLSASIQFTKNPQFTTRITRRTVRLAATASALPQKGKHALTGAWRFPLSKESEADAIFKSHNEFMESTHVVGNAEKDDTSHPRMLEYYISKAKELSEPMDDCTWHSTSQSPGPRNLGFFW